MLFYGFSKSGILESILKFSIHQFLRAAGEKFQYLCTSNTNHERFETCFDDFRTKMYDMFQKFPEFSSDPAEKPGKFRKKNVKKTLVLDLGDA